MSAPDHVIEQDRAGLSSFKVTRNASGNVQLEVKVYAESNTADALDEAQRQVTARYDELDAYYAPGGAK